MLAIKIGIGRKRIVIARMQNSKNRQVTFSKKRIGLFKKASEWCTLCGAYVVVVIYWASNKVYSCGHPYAELMLDIFLGENRQPDFDALNPTILGHQNVNVDEINIELNMVENSLEQQNNRGKSLQGLRKELPYEQLIFSDLNKISDLLEAADEEVERVANQLMEYDTKFSYQTNGMSLSPLRVHENNLSDFNEAPSRSNE